MSSTSWQIQPVEGEVALASVRALLQEYWDSFGFTPCFQNFGDELAGLPGAYAPPDGRLALATIDGAAGWMHRPCAAWMRIVPRPSAFTCARPFGPSDLAAPCSSGS